MERAFYTKLAEDHSLRSGMTLVQVAELSFLCGFLDSQKFRVESLLLHVQRSQLSWIWSPGLASPSPQMKSRVCFSSHVVYNSQQSSSKILVVQATPPTFSTTLVRRNSLIFLLLALLFTPALHPWCLLISSGFGVLFWALFGLSEACSAALTCKQIPCCHGYS